MSPQSPKYQQSPTAKYIWFQANNNNPIISTFLWVLELIGWLPSQHLIDESKQQNSNNKNNDTAELKGSSTDSLSSIKHNNSNTNNSNNSNQTALNDTKGKPERLCSSENDLAALGKSTSQRVTFATYQRNPHPSEPLNDFAEYDVSVSPAWGFYVAITPEQQEFYSNAATISNSKGNAGNTLLNAKSSYRKSPLW